MDELVGSIKALRAKARLIALIDPGTPAGKPPPPILDTCGTGGAPKLFNVSTIGAIVTAAAGGGEVWVAKHGNRSRTGRGSSELLEALGVGISAPAEVQARCLREIGVCYAHAPDHHPGARHAAAARKRLGVTIFNLLGPLANPAGATHQLVGTWTPQNAEKLAMALARLGCRRAWVVTSADGLDELTTTAGNLVFEVADGRVERRDFDAGSLGLPRARREELSVGSLEEAVGVARRVLAGESGPHTDMVALNAGASLSIAGVAPTLAEGVAMARAAIDRGEGERVLRELIRLTNE